MIGLIPIGGNATRMNGLPKFLLPVGDSFLLDILYRRMKAAGADTIAIGVKAANLDLVCQNVPEDAFVYEVNTETMSQTLLAARKHIDMSQPVLFGMPDTYWENQPNYTIYYQLRWGLDYYKAIAAAALWNTPPQYRHKRGMCMVNEEYIRQIKDKPLETTWRWGWGAVVWHPDFWQYINPYDRHVGFAMQRAIEDGQTVIGGQCKGRFYDCGTPDEYYECIRQMEPVSA